MASAPSDYEYLARRSFGLSAFTAAFILAPMAIILGFAWIGCGVTTGCLVLWFVVREWRLRGEIVGSFHMNEQEIHYELWHKPPVTLKLCQIARVCIYGPTEREYIAFELLDGTEMRLSEQELCDSIEPIADHLFATFPGPLSDFHRPKRPRGTLEQRLSGTPQLDPTR